MDINNNETEKSVNESPTENNVEITENIKEIVCAAADEGNAKDSDAKKKNENDNMKADTEKANTQAKDSYATYKKGMTVATVSTPILTQPLKSEKKKKKKKKPIWLFIILGIVGFFILCGIFGAAMSSNITTNAPISYDHVAVLYITGEISGNYKHTEMYGTSTEHDQVYLIDTIDALINNENNKGMVLYINSPGGEVMATDELCRKIAEYKSKTDRPVYAYFDTMAASGAYLIGSYADCIVANKLCVTGSIGVTYGTHIDLSGMLEKMGIKATDLIYGENKAMGSMFSPLTDEQKAIYNEQLKEIYDMMIDVISQNRGIDQQKLRNIANGQTFLASKAYRYGLIDYIGYYDQALATMVKECEFDEDIAFVDYRQEIPSTSLFSIFAKSGNNIPSASDKDALISYVESVSKSRRFMAICEQ